MKKNILEGLLKRIRKKVGKEKEEGNDKKECTDFCIVPDCQEILDREEQKCDSCDPATCNKVPFPTEGCSRRPN